MHRKGGNAHAKLIGVIGSALDEVEMSEETKARKDSGKDSGDDSGKDSGSTKRSDALVFFGATGDLAYKQIFPALQALVSKHNLNVPIIGIAKSGWNLDQLKKRAEDSLRNAKTFESGAFEKLSSLLQYIDGDYSDKDTYDELQKALGSAQLPLFYLAIPPNLFGAVVDGLANADCVRSGRVVVEKPFGRDLSSARKLNDLILTHFPEDRIFRIDHFLGKEPVQNLLYFRFANPTVEACWSNLYVDNVQITMAEKFDVSDRGKLYDEVGAIRDVVQNHILQMIANLAMESPGGGDHKSRRDERGQLLKAVRTLTPNDVTRGQYEGYRNEKGVAKDSIVETYASICFHIDNERWNGVPFYVRTGKCLPETLTEIIVHFKPSPNPVLDETRSFQDSYYRVQLGPQQVIALGLKVKTPGEAMVGEFAELVLHECSNGNEMQPYERLLGDAINGDPSLFAREDSVESSWRIVDDILDDATPIVTYAKNSWGPSSVNDSSLNQS